MNNRYAAAMIAIALSLLSRASLAQFATCEDAQNYGLNTGQLFVGQAFSKLGCASDSRRLLETENAIVDAFKTLVLNTSGSDEIKTCFYSGLYNGLLFRVIREYAKCGNVDAYACLQENSVAHHAGAIFVPLFKVLYPYIRASLIDRVFSDPYADAVCGHPSAQCRNIVAATVNESLAYEYGSDPVYQSVLFELQNVVCR